MGTNKLKDIFHPKSIAVIGASNNLQKVGYGVFKNVLSYNGKIFPINKKHDKILGKKAYKSILDVKENIDLVIIATPSNSVLSLVNECVTKKVKAIIIMSSGFKEIGKKGEVLCNKILNIARKNNVRVMGPNCMGFINPYLNLNASFANNKLKKGNIAFISQSGALGSSALDWALNHDLGFSFFASLGSMIDISFNDLIDYLGNDSNTQSIVIYMESLTDARKFMSAARAFSKTKPIIVLKSGRSDAGAIAARSHTGSLAGNDEVFDSAFIRAGIVRVNETDDLFDCAKTLSKQNKPKGKRLAIVTNAGGPGVLSTDTLVNRGGEIANLSKKTIQKLNRILPNNWSHANPVDILGDANANDYKKSIEICLNDENVDGVLVLLTPQTMTDSVKIAKVIASIKHDKPILASFMGGPSVNKGKEILEKGNIPTFPYPERAVKAFIYLYDYSKNIKSLYQTPGSIPHAIEPNSSAVKNIIGNSIEKKIFALDGDDSKKILASYGIPVSSQGLAKDITQAKSIANEIGYPVAMKIASPDILHKTELKAVRLDISSEKQLEKAYKSIIKNVKKYNPNAKINGIIVEKMSSKKYELIIGCKKDPIFGPVIVFGMGGVAVNVFKDTKIGIPPLNMDLAQSLIDKTKISKLLKGYRNMKGVDIDFLKFILYKFSYLVTDFPEILEIDINPFSIDEKGGVALDAKIVLDKAYIMKNKSNEPYSHLVIRPYPKEYINNMKTPLGKEFTLRPIKPEDEQLEKEMIEKFSKQTQKFRFLGEVKKITHDMLVQYTNNDYDRELGLAAEITENGKKKFIGVVRIVINPYENSAEFTIAIADPWQKKGFANPMMDYMLEITKRKGIKKIYGYFLEDNHIMRQMFEKRGFKISKQDNLYYAKKFL
jgi:acetyltransferase